MTQNQIAYAKLQEDIRHNRASEGETSRHNVAVEAETTRTNVANEAVREEANANDAYRNQVTEQHYMTSDSEAITHNRATEYIQGLQAKSSLLQADASLQQAGTAQYRAETERNELEQVKKPKADTDRAYTLQQIASSGLITPAQALQAKTQAALNAEKAKTEPVNRAVSIIHAGNEVANTIFTGLGRVGGVFKDLTTKLKGGTK